MTISLCNRLQSANLRRRSCRPASRAAPDASAARPCSRSRSAWRRCPCRNDAATSRFDKHARRERIVVGDEPAGERQSSFASGASAAMRMASPPRPACSCWRPNLARPFGWHRRVRTHAAVRPAARSGRRAATGTRAVRDLLIDFGKLRIESRQSSVVRRHLLLSGLFVEQLFLLRFELRQFFVTLALLGLGATMRSS